MRTYLPFLTGLAACLWGFCLNITGTDLSYAPGDLGDARFNNYILEHNFQWFSGKVDSYWSAPFMYPEKHTLTYSDNLMGTAPVYILYRLAGSTRDGAFVLWFITISLLNYAACYMFLFWLCRNSYAAVLGALVFACSLALQSQLTHAQTFVRFPVPLAFWMALRFVQSKRPKHLLLCGLAVAYQFYCAFYLGFLLIAPLGILLLVALGFEWKNLRPLLADWTWWRANVLAMVACGLVLCPLVIPYVLRAGEMGFHHYQAIIESVPEPSSRFYSKPSSLLWDFLSHVNDDHPSYWDDQIFPGGMAWLGLAGCVLFICIRGAKAGMMYLILMATALLSIFLFTRFGKFSFYNVAYNVVPGYPSMRSLQRVINVELIFFAAGVACCATLILRGRRAGMIFFPLLVAFAIADNYARPATIYRYPVELSRERVDALAARIRAAGSPPLISYEPEDPKGLVVYYHIDAMLAAQQCGVASLNGYTATSPRSYTPYWNSPDSASRARWLSHHHLDAVEVTVIR